VHNSNKNRVLFYRGFLENELYGLPELVRNELISILIEFQSNPADPQLHARCDDDGHGTLAYGLPNGYWVYMRIKSEGGTSFIDLVETEPVRILVLDVSIQTGSKRPSAVPIENRWPAK
jgi:hypothetical protein